jgi:hypothetical protein
MLDAFAEVSDRMGGIFYRGFSPEEIRAFEAALTRIYANLVSEE